jgi:hypothetical protein
MLSIRNSGAAVTWLICSAAMAHAQTPTIVNVDPGVIFQHANRRRSADRIGGRHLPVGGEQWVRDARGVRRGIRSGCPTRSGGNRDAAV